MNWRGYKAHVALAACILIVILGLGVRSVVFSRHVIAPLERDFAAIEGVAAAAVVGRGDYTDVVLTLGHVDDFALLFQKAERLRQARLPADSSRIVWQDGRTEALVESWRRLQFAVYEGAVTGRFTDMAAAVEELAASLPVDAVRLTMDERYVYVHLQAGDASMYEVVPLAPQLVGGSATGEGPR